MLNQPPDRRSTMAAAMARENLYGFLLSVFPIICPGETLSPAPYLEAMCFALQKVAAGQSRRLMISVDRASAKA